MSWRKERKNKNNRQVRFDATTKRSVLKRQAGKCAACGRENLPLSAHHVYPVRSYCGTGQGYPDTSFTRSAENCVLVCTSCHLKEAHKGDYVNGIAAADVFAHAHDGVGGKMSGVHIQWVEKLFRIQKGGCVILKADIRRGRKPKSFKPRP